MIFHLLINGIDYPPIVNVKIGKSVRSGNRPIYRIRSVMICDADMYKFVMSAIELLECVLEFIGSIAPPQQL